MNNYDNDDFSQSDGNNQFGNNNFQSMKKNIPVKPHMNKMNDYLNDTRNNLYENRKNAQIMRSENISLEHQTKQKCNELIKTIMDSLTNFEKELKRTIQGDKCETDFLKNQVQTLTLDKNKLQHNVLNIDSRLNTCENDVGML